MPINHRFLEHNFGNGFATHNAILDVLPDYKPQVLFVGTYNPDTNIDVNPADFFYGRNYFWPTMFNLFVEGNVIRVKKRRDTTPFTPTLGEILSLCERTHITFADLIKNTFHTEAYSNLTANTATYSGEKYNLIDDAALSKLHRLGLIEWSAKDIVDYIRVTPSIHCVRLTRQPTGIWQPQWNHIVNAHYSHGRQINFGTVHTPAGMGLYEGGVQIATALARRWLFHQDAHKRLCDRWIHNHQVPIQNFNY